MGKSETSVQCLAQEHLAGSVLEKSSFSPLACLLDLMPVRTNSEVQNISCGGTLTEKMFSLENPLFTEIAVSAIFVLMMENGSCHSNQKMTFCIWWRSYTHNKTPPTHASQTVTATTQFPTTSLTSVIELVVITGNPAFCFCSDWLAHRKNNETKKKKRKAEELTEKSLSLQTVS